MGGTIEQVIFDIPGGDNLFSGQYRHSQIAALEQVVVAVKGRDITIIAFVFIIDIDVTPKNQVVDQLDECFSMAGPEISFHPGPAQRTILKRDLIEVWRTA